MGTSLFRASANASSPHGYQSTFNIIKQVGKKRKKKKKQVEQEIKISPLCQEEPRRLQKLAIQSFNTNLPRKLVILKEYQLANAIDSVAYWVMGVLEKVGAVFSS